MNTTTNSNKAIKRSIILCWVALALCFLVKICGGNFFAIAVENERFIAVCEYIDTHIVLSLIVRLLNSLLMPYLYYCGLFGQLKLDKKQSLVLMPVFVLTFCAKLINVLVGNIVETIAVLLIPLMWGIKWHKSLVCYLIYNLFGIISAFIKSIGNYYLPEYSLIGIIFSIDVYMMIVLFMLYNYKRRI